MDRKQAIGFAWIFSAFIICPLSCFAQDNIEQNYQQIVDSSAKVESAATDNFGANLSLYDGGVEFENTDISIPGNNELAVELKRRFAVRNANKGELGGFGEWSLDIPYLMGTFLEEDGWNATGALNTDISYQRCTHTSPPRDLPGLRGDDYWYGNRLHPADGSDQLLLRDVENSIPDPADGLVYPWITKSFWRLSCKSTTKNDYPGEAFVAVSPSGVKYTFDWVVAKPAQTINKNGQYERDRVYFLVSRMEDRFGNYVTYTYSGNKLQSITSSDGRYINLTYSGDNIVAAASSAGSRTYTYTGSKLDRVNLPDQSFWKYSSSGILAIDTPKIDPGKGKPLTGCPNPGDGTGAFSMTVKSPAGATAAFNFEVRRHNRNNVPDLCTNIPNGPLSTSYRQIPIFFESFSLITKTVSGPGLEPLVWTYDYPTGGRPIPDNGGVHCWPQGPNGRCKPTKFINVIRPDTSVEQYEFGQLYRINEGLLVAKRIGTSFASLTYQEMYSYFLDDSDYVSQPFPKNVGFNLMAFVATSIPDSKLQPMRSRVVTSGGDTFNTIYNMFDNFGRPIAATKFSSTALAGVSRTEATVYSDNLSKWVLGQVKTVTCTAPSSCAGQVMQQTNYDATTALPLKTYAFGKLQQTMAYDTTSAITTGQLGTLKTVKDGNNNITTITGWKRGIPQKIAYPATPDETPAASQSAVVNDDGTIASVTDENGFTTGYTYDALGRLSKTPIPPAIAKRGR